MDESERLMQDFWKTKTLEQMTAAEWESLCDGCGRCCLQKLKNPTTGKIFYTSVACFLLDLTTCRCSDYASRHILVSDCVRLRAADIGKLKWLPKTCAYRLIAAKKELPDWHPLVSGDPESVHRAGISIRDRAISETQVHPDDLEKYTLSQRL